MTTNETRVVFHDDPTPAHHLARLASAIVEESGGAITDDLAATLATMVDPIRFFRTGGRPATEAVAALVAALTPESVTQGHGGPRAAVRPVGARPGDAGRAEAEARYGTPKGA